MKKQPMKDSLFKHCLCYGMREKGVVVGEIERRTMHMNCHVKHVAGRDRDTAKVVNIGIGCGVTLSLSL